MRPDSGACAPSTMGQAGQDRKSDVRLGGGELRPACRDRSSRRSSAHVASTSGGSGGSRNRCCAGGARRDTERIAGKRRPPAASSSPREGTRIFALASTTEWRDYMTRHRSARSVRGRREIRARAGRSATAVVFGRGKTSDAGGERHQQRRGWSYAGSRRQLRGWPLQRSLWALGACCLNSCPRRFTSGSGSCLASSDSCSAFRRRSGPILRVHPTQFYWSAE